VAYTILLDIVHLVKSTLWYLQTLLTVSRIAVDEIEPTQWSKELGQKGKQRSTKHTHKTKDLVTRTLLKTGDELRYSRRASRSCSTEVYIKLKIE
jgi:hypothetical protein